MSMRRYHNKPETETLTESERPTVTAGRDALRSLSKTFDVWVVVGRGIKVLRDKATAIGGKKTFHRLLAQNEYDSIDTSVITKLLKILDRLPEVETWRAGLSEKQQREWSAPTTVFKHCWVFGGKPPAKRAQPVLSNNPASMQREIDRSEEMLAEQVAENDKLRDKVEDLKEELKARSAKPSKGGAQTAELTDKLKQAEARIAELEGVIEDLEGDAEDLEGTYATHLKDEPVEMQIAEIIELLDWIDLPLAALIKCAEEDGRAKLLRGLPDAKKPKPKRKPAPV